MKKHLCTFALLFLVQLSFSQKVASPYQWDWTTDGIWTGLGLAGSTGGLILIKKKKDLSLEELNNLDIKAINGIDRWAAGNNSVRASSLSDIPFGASFAAPVAMLIDGDINDHTGQVLLLYLESLSTTATLYTMTVGIVNRSRPYVYDDSGETSISRRLNANGQRSFFAGHVAASATGTFFAAKMYHDFHPDSPAVPWVWAGAAAIPAAVAYLRIDAGQHFLTDVTVGYIIGAGIGILVPELHKKRNKKLDLSPTSGVNPTGHRYTGLSLRYQF